MTEHRLIRPLDVLHLHGNRLFADARHGDSVMPPWPSVFAGALRTRILVDRDVDFAAFGNGKVKDRVAAEVVGRGPDAPGSFRVTLLGLTGPPPRDLAAREKRVGTATSTCYLPAPADLVAVREDGGKLTLHRMEPVLLPDSTLATGSPLSCVPVLRTEKRVKPVAGVWLTAEALSNHLREENPDAAAAVTGKDLWLNDLRLGIALSETRTAASGLLYTTDTVALRPDVGFLVGVDGADGVLPADGLVRLGGEGRGAEILSWKPGGEDKDLPWNHRPTTEGFRMVLATPGIFPSGWLPPCIAETDEGYVLSFRGLKARLVAAAVDRHETISGWDVARARPKSAERVVPAGSVYWFRCMEQDSGAIETLATEGLWPLMGDLTSESAARRAEGFNNVWFGDWVPDPAVAREV